MFLSLLAPQRVRKKRDTHDELKSDIDIGKGDKKMVSKYERKVLPRLAEVRDWAMRGVRDKDIASNLAIAYSTFRGYIAKHSELAKALSVSKNAADAVVANSFYDKCRDRVVDIPTAQVVERETIGADGTKKKTLSVEVVDVPTFIPADVRAQKTWLFNRRPDEWRQKVEAEMSGDVKVEIISDEVVDGLSE